MRTTLANISASLLALLYMPHASGAAAIVGRQTVSGAPFPLNVVQSGSTLGGLWVDPTTGIARLRFPPPVAPVSPVVPAPSIFSIDPTTGFLYVNNAGTPHAFIEFSGGATICSSSGPVVFGTSDSYLCAEPSTFTLNSARELAFDGVTQFELCGTDRHIEFRTHIATPDPTPLPTADAASCTVVQIVAPTPSDTD